MIVALLLQLGGCVTPTLQHRIDSLVVTVPGHLGVGLGTGTDGLLIGTHLAEHFPMQSVYKLPIVMAVLDRVDHGALSLDQVIPVSKAGMVPGIHSPIRDAHPDGVSLPLRELMRLAIVESDGTASDILLSLVPPPAVTRYVRGLGVEEMVIATSEREMTQGDSVQYRNWASPRGAVALLERLGAGRALSPGSRALVWRWLVESTPGANRLKRWLPAGTEVAHKTGTSGTGNGLTRATNDIGSIVLPDGKPLYVAVFVSDSRAGEAEREEVIAQVALAAWRCATTTGSRP